MLTVYVLSNQGILNLVYCTSGKSVTKLSKRDILICCILWARYFVRYSVRTQSLPSISLNTLHVMQAPSNKFHCEDF